MVPRVLHPLPTESLHRCFPAILHGCRTSRARNWRARSNPRLVGYGGRWVNTPLHRVSGKQPPGSKLRRTEPLKMGISSKCSPGLAVTPSRLPHSRSFDSIPGINHLNTSPNIRSCSGGEVKLTSLSSGNGVLGRFCEQLLNTRILRSKDMYFLALELSHSRLPGMGVEWPGLERAS